MPYQDMQPAPYTPPPPPAQVLFDSYIPARGRDLRDLRKAQASGHIDDEMIVGDLDPRVIPVPRMIDTPYQGPHQKAPYMYEVPPKVEGEPIYPFRPVQGSSVPGIGYPSTGHAAEGEPRLGPPAPRIPDSFPYEEMTPPPPEMLERLRSTDRGFHMEVPAHLRPRKIDPGIYGPRTSTTIVIPPGSNAKNREMLEGLSKEIGKGMEGLSPIIEALMGTKGKK
tara:strand:+ start:515 stop:1183 length:669 start_codon:yes stop_codon:yes gene_type:complete